MVHSADQRRRAILEAALNAFSQYGFARTKMADISAASGVARTALYKTYSNKQHIFRDLAAQVHRSAIETARPLLDADSAFPQRLEDALIARDIHLLAVGHTGPHADEIAELYLSLAHDLAEEHNAAWVQEVSAAVTRAVKAGHYRVPPAYKTPHDLAYLLRLALEGVKKEVKTPQDFEHLARQLIRGMLGF